MTIQRVAIVVVGDEILSGDTQETNAHYMARGLADSGVSLQRIVVIPDERDVIAAEVRALSGSHDVVITCGGIGPTHDDVTMESIAQAFGVDLVEHPELLALLRKWRGDELDDSYRTLAQVPEGTELVWTDEYFPLTRMRNVYILPGVPRLLRKKFDQLLPDLRGEPIHQRQFQTDTDEVRLAEPLAEVQRDHADVSIGSYPRSVASNEWVVRLVLKARDRAALDSACEDLQQRLDNLEELPRNHRSSKAIGFLPR